MAVFIPVAKITGDFSFEEAMMVLSPLTRAPQFSNDGSGGWVRTDPSAVTLSVMPSTFGTFPAFTQLSTGTPSISFNGRFHPRGQITGDFSFEEATALANALENQLENQVLLIEEKDLK